MLDWKRTRSYLAAAAMAASLGACHNPTGGDCPPGTTGTSPNCTLIPPTPPPSARTLRPRRQALVDPVPLTPPSSSKKSRPS